MSTILYKNTALLQGDGLFRNGQIVIETNHTQYTEPAKGAKPVKVKPTASAKIIYAGPAADMKADEVIDLEGRFVIPGLIDAAARMDTLPASADDYTDNIGTAFRTFLALRGCAEALNCGVTTICCVGMPNNIDIALKTASSKGMYAFPGILATGPVFGVNGGRGHEKYGLIECSGADGFRAQVRIHLSRGLDGLTFQLSGDRMESLGGNFRPEMTPSEIDAMAKHVRGAEKPVSVNASGDVSVRMALNADVNIIRQGYSISRALLEEMAQKDIAYVPCLVSTIGTDLHEIHKQTVRSAIEAGVRIAAGTEILPSEPLDGTCAMVRELELLCELGMSPAQALKSAGAAAADVLRIKTGTIEGGRPADLLVLDQNPAKDIRALRGIRSVICRGRLIPEDPSLRGGSQNDWTLHALKGVKEPENYNTTWNLIKEI